MTSEVATRRYRLVRNIPMERFALGHTSEFAPRFDVEQIDAWHMPVMIIATGVTAMDARALIAREGGVEVQR